MTAPRPEPAEPAEAPEPSPEASTSGRGLIALIVVMSLILVGLIVALVVVASGSDEDDIIADPDTTEAPEPEPEPEPEEPVEPVEEPAEETVDPAALFADVASGAGALVASDTIEVNGALVGFAALRDENVIDAGTGAIRYWTWDGAQWNEAGTITTLLPVGSWILADVTGDGISDLVLDMYANDMPGGVLTAHSGAWELPGFQRDGEPV